MAGVRGFGGPGARAEPAAIEQVRLPGPRLSPPAALAAICSVDRRDRAAHAHGQSYRDLVRAFRGRFDHVPDVVARPGTEGEIEALLGWCASAGAAAIPFGGGTSVVGGVEPAVGDRYAGVVCIDLARMNRVLEVDPISGAALIQAGATGPRLNAQLAEHGRTLRHFPQSWEFSTLGGGVAPPPRGPPPTGGPPLHRFPQAIPRPPPPRGLEAPRPAGGRAGA